MPKRGDSAEYALEQPQIAKLLDVCSTLEDKVIIKCMLYLGLRIAELAHMRADWITAGGDFRIPSTQQCSCYECRTYRGGSWHPKTRAGIRILPIPGTIRKDLLKFLELQPNGLCLTRLSLWKHTKVLLKRANIRVKGLAQDTGFPHCLRSTCLTMLAVGGMSAAALAYFAGWSNINVASHYVNLAQAKKAAEKGVKEIFG